MPVQSPPRPLPVLASVLAVVVVVLAVAGCAGQIENSTSTICCP